jgi:hypothetical protein
MVSRARAANEPGFADLKNRRISPRSAWTPVHATMLLRALLVLTNAEFQR